MAAKVRMMKLLQEIRGLAEITNRRPHSKPPGLFLLQLRSHLSRTRFHKRKVIIPIDIQNPPDIPSPVKITFVTPCSAEALPLQPQ